MTGYTPPVINLTIREQALEALVTLFKGMNTTTPEADPYPFNWAFVQRAHLDEKSWQKNFSLGIYDGGERPEIQNHVIYRKLQVTCEFRALLQVNTLSGVPDDPSTVGNMMLGALQRRIYDNYSNSLGNNLGGLVSWVQETGNEIWLPDLEDRRLSGMMTLEICYRTRTVDPRFTV
jgi:hypothetical protein